MPLSVFHTPFHGSAACCWLEVPAPVVVPGVVPIVAPVLY
jgi:hypothetical protein